MISSSSNIGWLDGLNEYIYGFHRTSNKESQHKAIAVSELIPDCFGALGFHGGCTYWFRFGNRAR